MGTITRHTISKNFRCLDLRTNEENDIRHLEDKIDLWKYLLTNRCLAVKGESILIGIVRVNLDYLAICMAAAELALKIVIVDYSRKDDFQDVGFFDAKTKLLSPIDIFIHDISKNDLHLCSKHNFFVSCAKRSFHIIEDIDYTIDQEEYQKAKSIFPDAKDVLMKCTSSGTTGTPKIIEHTHEFLYAVSKRNAKKFYGNCLHIKNLNHGSSLAVYLLPSLISDLTTQHLFLDLDEDDPFDYFINTISAGKDDLDFIIFPYPFMIDKFLNLSRDKNIKWPRLRIQTLSYIQDTVKDYIKNSTIKSITSIFGSNETSGPVFENTIDRDSINKSASQFSKPDDFYKISLDDNGLITITLPFYNQDLVTNDIFVENDGFFIHQGRSDFIKINGEIIDVKIINEVNQKYTDICIITDALNNCLYLAYWHQEDLLLQDELKKYFAEKYPRAKITKSKLLNKKNFLSGIKLDNEMLREYFRNHV